MAIDEMSSISLQSMTNWETKFSEPIAPPRSYAPSERITSFPEKMTVATFIYEGLITNIVLVAFTKFSKSGPLTTNKSYQL